MKQPATRLASVALLCGALLAHAAPRERMDLFGEWQVKLTMADQMAAPPTPDETWVTLTLPNRWGDGDHNAAWLSRTFDAPTDIAGKAFILKIDSIYVGVRVFVNGQDCGHYISGFAPVTVDVTQAVKPGANTIHLGVTNPMVNRELYGADGVDDYTRSATLKDRKLMALYQPIRIEVVPAVYIADIFAIPSVKHGEMAAEIEIANTTAIEQEVDVHAMVCELDRPGGYGAGREVHRLNPARISVPASTTRTVRLSAPWKNPRLWWPHDPHLYALKAELSATSDKSDALFIRFGFREVRVEGYNLLLNGQRFVFRADSALSRYGANWSKEDALRFFREYVVNAHNSGTRVHFDTPEQTTLDAADELGVPLLQQSNLAAGACYINRPAFWQAQADQWTRYIKLSRNHPSIIIWAIGNEITFYGGNSNPGAPSLPFLPELVKATRRADPTRPVTSSHDFQLYPYVDFFEGCLQWPFVHTYRTWDYWDRFGEQYKRDKPWLTDEMSGGVHLGTMATIVGDKAYITCDFQNDGRSYWGKWAETLNAYMNFMEMRKQPYFAAMMLYGDPYTFWTPQGVAKVDDAMMAKGRRALAAVAIAPREWNGDAQAGRPFKADYVLMNDAFTPLKGRLFWKIVPLAGGNALAAGAERLDIPPATHRPWTMSARLPASDQPIAAQIRFEIRDPEGHLVMEEDQELGILPPPRWTALKPVVLWPEAGEWANLSEKTLPLKRTVSAELPSAGSAVVVVPRGARPKPSQWRQLEDYLFAGGRALVLADESYPGPFAGTEIRGIRRPVWIAHARSADHPILKEIPAKCLWHWVGADVPFYSPPVETNVPSIFMAKRPTARPTRGNYRTLIDAAYRVDADHNEGLVIAPMIEVRAGKGRAIFCSLLLGGGLKAGEPAAATLLERSLAYLQTPGGWRGGEPRPAVAIGVDLTPLGFATTDRLAEASALIIHAASDAGKAALARDEWVGYLREGGTVLINNASAEQIAAIAGATGVKLEAFAATDGPPNGKGPPTRLDWVSYDWINESISHFDASWNEFTGMFAYVKRQPIARVGVKAEAPGAVNPSKQGALVAVPVGKGWLVLDQTLWAGELQPSAVIRARAAGYASQLLSNLDVAGRRINRAISDAAPMADAQTVVLYHFEDRDLFPALYDDGPAGLNMTATDDVEIVPGKFGTALRFKTAQARLRQDNPELIHSPENTIDFWIRPAGDIAQAAGIIMATYRWGDHMDFVISMLRDGRVYCGAGNHTLVGQTALPAGEWTRVTLTRSVANNRMRLYLNGKLDAEAAHSGYYPVGIFFLGHPTHRHTGVNVKELSNTFAGTIDELHIRSIEWTESE